MTATAAITTIITTAAMPAYSAVLGPPVGFSGVEGDGVGVGVAVGGAVVGGAVGDIAGEAAAITPTAVEADDGP